jgi:hypothetical protein
MWAKPTPEGVRIKLKRNSNTEDRRSRVAKGNINGVDETDLI